MTIKPFWNTNAGTLGSVVGGVMITPIQLEALNTNTIEVLSKSLPDGLKLNSGTQTITGIPRDAGIDKTYDFVLRATNNSGINNSKVVQDRTFSIQVTSNSVPSLLQPEGTLKITSLKENYILNNSTISYQFTASSTSIPAGQSLKYYIQEGQGELPPGLRLTDDGLLYGTISDDLDLDYKVVQGSYDKDYYDINPYDYGANIEQATARVGITGGKITSTQVNYGGNGYLLDPEVIIGGSIYQVQIVANGSGYTTAPEVAFGLSPTPGGVNATGYAVLTSGAVTSIVVTNPGTGYTTAPAIKFKGQNTGSGVEATCTLRSGSGAELIARVSNGSLVALDIIGTGSGYAVPPLISFGLPTAGSKVISKIYKFAVTVSNGNETDTKKYTILVKSEDSLRVDTTFILSDTLDFDTSKTYIQAPIWISPSVLPSTQGDNNFIYDLQVFDPTPSVGKIFYSLMDVNFDGTTSELGPLNDVKNAAAYSISAVELTRPAKITLTNPSVFKDGDRIKLYNINGTYELDSGIFYVKIVDIFNYQLYLDRYLINEVDALLYHPYIGGGSAHYSVNYLDLDTDGGEIYGFIPYQPFINKTYQFTIKSSRIIDNEEVASVFKQFELTVKGNIEGDISFTSPKLLGSLRPNEQCLLEVTAASTIPSSSIIYELIPGYGKVSKTNYVELTLSEQNGHVYIEGYGLDPIISFEMGQTYKINVALTSFTASFRNLDSTYYNSGLSHSSGTVGVTAQEKSSGYYIFTPPYNTTTQLKIVYTNTKKDGLFLGLKQYNIVTKQWSLVDLPTVFSSYEAEVYHEEVLFDKVYDMANNTWTRTVNGNIAYALFLDYTTVQFQIKKYNPNTFTWEAQNIPQTKAATPTNDSYWLDLDNSNYGILDFRYFGLQGVWTSVKPALVSEIPNNSVGINSDYRLFNDNGLFKIVRKVNTVWKVLKRLRSTDKGAYDPNVFFVNHYGIAPSTNLQHDTWFKYTALYGGLDKEISVVLKTLDSLPTELSISSNGDIIGRISPNTGNTYRSFYVPNVLYIVNDVVTFNNSFYICVNQYRSSGDWYTESNNWVLFFFPKRVVTSIDVNTFSSSTFSIAGVNGDDGTTIDKLFRFRVRAKDTQNVGFIDKDFNIEYIASSNITLTNIYLQPFLSKTSRENYFNFITNPVFFPQESIYRAEDKNFGLQRIPKMLLLGGIENTVAERFASAVQRNYYDRPLYFGDVKVAIAKNGEALEYELLYVEINDPYEVNGNSVVEKISLGFDYDPLTVDYTKIRMDATDVDVTETGLQDIYPSSITLMQAGLQKVSQQKIESVLTIPTYDGPYIGSEPLGWGIIPTYDGSTWNDLDPSTSSDDWGLITERVSLTEDFLAVILTLTKDEKYRPLWMNTSQDGTGNVVGYVKAVPICYLKPGESAKVLKLVNKSDFDFKTLNFTIDRIIIQNPQGETGDKYIKFINREII